MPETGLDDFVSILEKLPSKYDAVRRQYKKKAEDAKKKACGKRIILGNMTAELFHDILFHEEHLPISAAKAIYENNQVRPDLLVGDRIAYIEIKKWDDSNSLRSAIFEGYLVKIKIPESKFYILYGGGDYSGGPSLEFYKQHTRIGLIEAVDGWFDAGTIEKLAGQLRCDIKNQSSLV